MRAADGGEGERGGEQGGEGVAPRLRRAAAQMILSRWLALVIGVAALAVLSRLLTPQAFGLYAGLLALAALAEVVCDFGVAARLVRLDTLSRAERAAGEGLALLLSGLVAGAALAAALLLGGRIGAEARGVLLLLAPCVLLVGVIAPSEAALSRALRFGLIARLGVLRMAVEAGTAIALAAAGLGPVALAGGLLAHRTVQAGLLLLARHREGEPYAPSLRGAGAFLRFGRDYVVMESLPKGGDAAVKGAMAGLLGLAGLGLFDRAKQVVGLLDETLLKGIAPIVLPGLARALQAGEAPRAVYRAKTDMLIALLWPTFAVVALLAEPLVLTLLGAQWTEAVPAVRTLAAAGLALPIGKMSANLFVALDAVPAYTRIRIVHQLVRVGLVALGATQGLVWACAGGAASSFVRAGLVEAALHRRIGHRSTDLARPARDGALLTLGALAGPAALLWAWPEAPAAVLAVGGAAAAGLGWLAVAIGLRHRLATEALTLLAELRAARGAPAA